MLCVADLSKGAVIVYAGVPPHISPGQVSQRSFYLTIFIFFVVLLCPNGCNIIYIKIHVFVDGQHLKTVLVLFFSRLCGHLMEGALFLWASGMSLSDWA